VNFVLSLVGLRGVAARQNSAIGRGYEAGDG